MCAPQIIPGPDAAPPPPPVEATPAVEPQTQDARQPGAGSSGDDARRRAAAGRRTPGQATILGNGRGNASAATPAAGKSLLGQ